MNDVVQNPTPLRPNYIPGSFVDREEATSKLDEFLSAGLDLVIQGPRGTGKTHLVRKQLHELDGSIASCYVPCTRYSTQYQVLAQIYETLFGESVEDGHHTGSLQRRVEDGIGAVPLIVVLDDIDFLLLNDGNDLLYFLSRLDADGSLSLVLISGSQTSFEDRLEERTYSSLYPREIALDRYSDEELFQILADRSRKALAPKSLRREALDHIASSVEDAGFGLCWLRTAAEKTQDVISKSAVQDAYPEAYEYYAGRLLNDFSEHHRLLYEAIVDLDEEHEDNFRAGDVYQRYRKLCSSKSITSLSNRRLSDFLKELEALDLIEAEYYYGGHTGKTREISLNEFVDLD